MAAFVLLSYNLKSQPNLIYNGSFELHDTCPYNSNQLEFSLGWINPTLGTPDYFHVCATNPNFGVPFQGFGFYYQLPRTGSAYAHFGLYNSMNIREYLQTKLNDSLQFGRQYYLEYYVNLTNVSQYCIYEVGAYFSFNQIISSDNLPLMVSPQIENSYPLCDTLLWLKISGFYNSSGNEKYLTIGNFNNDNSTTWNYFDSSGMMSWATYYIDDVSLFELIPQAFTGPDTTICRGSSAEIGKPKTDSCDFSWTPSTSLDDAFKANPLASPDTTTTYVLTISGCGATITDTVTVFVEPCIDASSPLVNLYPNPASGVLTVEYSSAENFELAFYDMLGRKIIQNEISPGYFIKTEMDLIKLSSGIYNVFVVQQGDVIKKEKIIVIK